MGSRLVPLAISLRLNARAYCRCAGPHQSGASQNNKKQNIKQQWRGGQKIKPEFRLTVQRARGSSTTQAKINKSSADSKNGGRCVMKLVELCSGLSFDISTLRRSKEQGRARRLRRAERGGQFACAKFPAPACLDTGRSRSGSRRIDRRWMRHSRHLSSCSRQMDVRGLCSSLCFRRQFGPDRGIKKSLDRLKGCDATNQRQAETGSKLELYGLLESGRCGARPPSRARLTSLIIGVSRYEVER